MQAQPVAAFGVDSVSDFCAPASITFLNQSTDSLPLNYFWYFGSDTTADTSTNPVHLFSDCGNYSVTLIVTDSTGASDTTQQVFTIFCPPQAAFTLSLQNGCDSATVAFTDATTSADSIVQWLWTFGDSASIDDTSFFQYPVHAYATPGIYPVRLTVTTSAGCTGYFDDTVSIFNSPIVTILNDSVVCKGDTVAFTGIVLSDDSIAGYVYHFGDPGSGANDTAITQNATHTFSAAGFYIVTLTVTTTNGCVTTDSGVVFVWPLPPALAGADTALCAGDTIQLHASGGIGYSWNGSASLSDTAIADPLAYPLTTTQYVVTVSGNSGCKATDTIEVLVSTPPVISFGSFDTSACANGSAITLSAMPAGGTFSGSGVNGNEFDPSAVMPGADYVIAYVIMDSAGCVANDSVSIFVHEPPSVAVSSSVTAVCANGDSVSFLLVPAGGILSGEGVQGTSFHPELTGGAGNYVVHYSVTDSFNCSNSDSVSISVLPIPTLTVSGDTIICLGDSVQLAASGAPGYLWQPVISLSDSIASNPIAFPTSTTEYNVTGTDTNGCASLDSVLVTVNSPDSIQAGMDTAVCIGTLATLHASGGNSYSWSPGNVLDDSLAANPVASIDTTTTFVVTGTIGTCVGSDTVTVTVNPLPVISAGTDTAACFSSNITLHATGGVNYEWQPGSPMDDSTSANPTAFITAITTFTVMGTDANGCSATDDVTVSVLPLPVVSASVDPVICAGDSVIMTATGALSYSWIPAAGLSAPDQDTTFAFPQVTTTYIVYGTDSNGCGSYADTTITVHPLPQIVMSDSQVVCPLFPVQLFASGGDDYLWQPATGLNNDSIANPIATVSAPITYTVTVTDSNSCHASGTVALTLFPPLFATVGADTIICPGTSAQLHAGGGVNYLWLPSVTLDNGLIADPVASPSATTTYTVYVGDGVCYTDTLSVKVTVQSPPQINAGSDITLYSGASQQLNVTATQGTYHWWPDSGLDCSTCLNPVVTAEQSTTYTVTVTDSAGCTASDDLLVSVICGDDIVFVPNAFTPNGNGHNDVLYVRSYGAVTLQYFRVYNRWGKIIFESHNLSDGWDGLVNGKPMTPGVYLYELSVTCDNGTEVQKQGNVTLLK